MVPPVAVASRAPSVFPVHETSVAVIDALSAVGSVIVTVAVAVQLFASVTVTVKLPAATFDRSSVVAPLLQL